PLACIPWQCYTLCRGTKTIQYFHDRMARVGEINYFKKNWKGAILMPPSTFWQVLRSRSSLNGCLNKRFLGKLLGVVFLLILVFIEIGPLIGPSVFAQITTL